MIRANELLPVSIDQNQRQATILLLDIIGTGFRYRDQDEQALKVFKLAEACISELSQEELQQLEETPHIINIYINLAQVCHDLKKEEECQKYTEIAINKTEEQSDPYVNGMVFTLAGGILLDYGKTEEAAHYLKQGYKDAIASHYPGNALIAASHLMTIEGSTSHLQSKDSQWKKKADQLLPQVQDEYPGFLDAEPPYYG